MCALDLRISNGHAPPCPSSPLIPRPEREEIMANYMLVSFKTCPWVQRSAIILSGKNEPFEFRHIESDNRPDWFLAISPRQKGAGAAHRRQGDIASRNPSAINEYLDEVVSPQLHPADPIERAINRAWTDYVPTFSSQVTGCAYAATKEAYEAAIAKIPDAFGKLEGALEKQGSGPFFNGAEVSRQIARRRLCAVPAALLFPRPGEAARRHREIPAPQGLGHDALMARPLDPLLSPRPSSRRCTARACGSAGAICRRSWKARAGAAAE